VKIGRNSKDDGLPGVEFSIVLGRIVLITVNEEVLVRILKAFFLL
jgi:hypothetical protein